MVATPAMSGTLWRATGMSNTDSTAGHTVSEARVGTSRDQDRYALGHSAEELERLETQARIVDPVTRRFWATAGVGPGMRVLDVGCGAGHTSVLLAEMVGEQGHVVGIDNAAGAVAAAQARSQHRTNVSYIHGDPTLHDFGAPFDAVVGRYVLMFQPDPASFLAAAACHARPGGVVCFHELDANGVTSRPPVPTFDQLACWNTEVTQRYGANPNFGSSLYATYLTAGLGEPTLLADAIHGQGAEAADVLLQVRNLARSLLTEMEHFGVATSDQVGIDTVFDRMMAEATATDSIVVGHLQVGAYCSV
jgi:2-polyprenyl-3-methyl-5-hydroxy-6-metoxy-1,4-benzoquinol methylase